MKQFELEFSNDPSFNTVINLTNKTFNPDNITEGRMATEDQILQLEQRYNEVQQIVDYCCRDIVVWKTFVRIIDSSGNVVSPYGENVVVGTARRGKPFTVTFSPNFNPNTYKTTSDGVNPVSITRAGGLFSIRYTASNTDQQSRRWTEEVLYKDSTTVADDLTVREFPDDPAYTGSSYYVPNVTEIGNFTEAIPVTKNGFTIYFNGGTLAIDVRSGSIFRGVINSYPNDPAYTAIFYTQFVEK